MQRKRLWFKAKRYGWGWYPVTWQGFAVLVMYIFSLLAQSVFAENHTHSGSDFLQQLFPQIYILTVFLIIICYATGETPRWRWGKPKEEMIDVLDAWGAPTGTIATRTRVHEEGLWHKGVHVFVLNSKNEVLIQKRSLEKVSNPGMWTVSAGGHIEAGQSALATAKRETAEEIGLRLTDADLTYIGTIRDCAVLNKGTYINNAINDVFLVRKNVAISDLQKQESEVSELRWISLEEYRKHIAERDSNFIAAASIGLLFTHLDFHGSDKK